MVVTVRSWYGAILTAVTWSRRELSAGSRAPSDAVACDTPRPSSGAARRRDDRRRVAPWTPHHGLALSPLCTRSPAPLGQASVDGRRPRPPRQSSSAPPPHPTPPVPHP